jgi:hypothetical protein
MASVSSSLNSVLDIQAADSAAFFDTAYTGYKRSGRGALVAMFPSIEALQNNKHAVALYVPRRKLIDLDSAEVLICVDKYDPEQCFVALAVVTISQKEDHAILAGRVVHKHC